MIVEGIVEKKSQGTSTTDELVKGGKTYKNIYYEFWEIGGKRLKDISVDGYLDSIIDVGNSYKLAFFKSKGNHVLSAVQEPNGNVEKAKVNKGEFFRAFMGWVFASILCAIIYGSLFYSGSPATQSLGSAFAEVAFWGAIGGAGLAYLIFGRRIQKMYKARDFFD